MQTLLIEFRITDAKAWESLDGDQERQEVARLIDDALKRAEAGKWTGSAQRRTSRSTARSRTKCRVKMPF
jgi:hypothetical protein